MLAVEKILREAVFVAEQDDVFDTIIFDLPPNEDTITLIQGDLDITEELIINGPGQDINGNFVVTISGNNSSRIFEVFSTSLEINGLKLTEGAAISFPDIQGGAINSLQSDLMIRDSEISGNQASIGGGLYVDAYDNHIEIHDSTISGNTSHFQGGGIRMDLSGASQALIDSTTIAENYAGYQPAISYSGGGMNVDVSTNGHFTLTGSTISGNKSYGDSGGIALRNYGDSQIVNSTISGNQSVGGGGGLIVSDQPGGLTRISHSTIVFNTAGFIDGSSGLITPPLVLGGGLIVLGNAYTGSTRTLLDHTIVGNNADLINRNPDPFGLDAPTPDVFISAGARGDGGTIAQQHISAAYSLISDVKGGLNSPHPSNPDGIIPAVASGALIGPSGVDPQLKDNGGPTFTHVPLTGSLAIDAGNPLISSPPTTDQRGFGRIADGDGNGSMIIDIGAVEKNGLPLVDAPRIIDIQLTDGSSTEFSFDSLVSLGQQLKPIDAGGLNTVKITFTEDVRMKSATGALTTLNPSNGLSLLQLKQTVRNTNGSVSNNDLTASSFSYDAMLFEATWTFSPTMVDGKYALYLMVGNENSVEGIADVDGNNLDADWTNDTAGTPDDWQDDPIKSFANDLGNGVEGTDAGFLRFHFAIDDTNSSTTLPLLEIGGADLNDDEMVDGLDLAIWQAGYGGTEQGDVDGDGDADGADFLLWQRAFGTYSAWGEPPFLSVAAAYAASFGLTLEELTTGLTPKVLNLIISGSQSTHDAYSFDTVDGSGAQLASVPVGGADTISIVFSEGVNVTAQSLIVIGLTTANVPQLAAFSYDPATYTATWRLEGWALADNYLLYLSDSITDAEGNFLDGEWTNPASMSTTNSLVSTFPSGDGVSGGSFSFAMTLMPDVNQDNIVNYTDYYTAYYGEQYGVIGDFTDGDFNGNGVVDQEDVDLVNSLLGESLQEIEILADVNGDERVDNSDLTIIWTNYGMTGATREDGDLDGDQQITDADLDLAFAQFGLGFDMVA